MYLLCLFPRCAERTDLSQQWAPGEAGLCAGAAALSALPGPPAPVCGGCGLRPERPGQEDQRGGDERGRERGGEELGMRGGEMLGMREGGEMDERGMGLTAVQPCR